MEISVITKFDYDQALSISDDKDFQKHYNSCFTSNYLRDSPMAQEVNMDIQPVFN